MEKQIFKVGDRVFDILYGWGKVIDDNKGGLFPIGVQFDDDDSQEVIVYTDDGKHMPGEESPLLSFTEYTLQGFTQERPIDYSECIGKWGRFWDDDKNHFIISKLFSYDDDKYEEYPLESLTDFFKNFEPLTEEQIKVLEL